LAIGVVAALIACGGGGGGSTPAAVNPPGAIAPLTTYAITSTISPTPNYSHLGVDHNKYVNAFSYQPAGIVFATGMDGIKKYSFFLLCTIFLLNCRELNGFMSFRVERSDFISSW
jgi:hypothetical protein